MKKRIAGAILFMLMYGMISGSIYAAEPEVTCKIYSYPKEQKITAITAYNRAISCEVELNGFYSGGRIISIDINDSWNDAKSGDNLGGTYVKSAYSIGTVAASATVAVTTPNEFIAAIARHRVDYYINGVLNTFKTESREILNQQIFNE